MSWFSKKPCAVCAEKDARIADLREQISDLRRMALMPSPTELLTPSQREADLVLSPDENHVALREAQYEAASVMSGNFENFQIEVS